MNIHLSFGKTEKKRQNQVNTNRKAQQNRKALLREFQITENVTKVFRCR